MLQDNYLYHNNTHMVMFSLGCILYDAVLRIAFVIFVATYILFRLFLITQFTHLFILNIEGIQLMIQKINHT